MSDLPLTSRLSLSCSSATAVRLSANFSVLLQRRDLSSRPPAALTGSWKATSLQGNSVSGPGQSRALPNELSYKVRVQVPDLAPLKVAALLHNIPDHGVLCVAHHQSGSGPQVKLGVSHLDDLVLFGGDLLGPGFVLVAQHVVNFHTCPQTVLKSAPLTLLSDDGQEASHLVSVTFLLLRWTSQVRCVLQ